ncbi:metal-dependent hydrolase [Tissierella praeacuta]|uniref:metal-dependent hydrolase n=1 Tax=Tissierella praeacuta TaxID=43131 RepID=UPI0035139D5D
MIIFKGLTHTLVALSLYFLFFDFDLIIIISIVLGSLIPDIDIVGKYNILAQFMKHRGKMHTFLILTLISILLFLIDTNFALGFAYGYTMHLIMDTLTPMGIMWAYPINDKYYSLNKRFNYRILEPVIVGICSVFLFLVNFKIIMYSYLAYGMLKISRKFIF